MARRLTLRQQEILTFILDYIQEKSYPPTFREIGEAIGINSTKAVNDHLAVLERKGFIHREKNKSRAIHILALPDELGYIPGPNTPGKVVTLSNPVHVVEGAAIAANPLGTTAYEDYGVEALQIDASLFGGGKCFALRVSGDSMEGAHICDGDLAIIRQQEQVNNGEIAAVDMDGEVTLKYFKRQGATVALISANPQYEPRIIDTTEVPVRILGRYVGIIRSQQ